MHRTLPTARGFTYTTKPSRYSVCGWFQESNVEAESRNLNGNKPPSLTPDVIFSVTTAISPRRSSGCLSSSPSPLVSFTLILQRPTVASSPVGPQPLSSPFASTVYGAEQRNSLSLLKRRLCDLTKGSIGVLDESIVRTYRVPPSNERWEPHTSILLPSSPSPHTRTCEIVRP
ncbi:hypothetical protein CDEST_05467 [Colletotrichum destructivum]|uniref:Uncharacterized protein n=1 Tax=Colletotrichum destructivum TaxID=34406 RepID=A0AAX4IBT2_9PEZI|nr:hypothetical protein CDEST_05467 [Colletotrichum destructivum]